MSSALREAIQALRQVLDDEDAGNDRVLDCAIEVVAAYDQLPHDCAVTITAKADFRYAFVQGIEAAREQGIEYSNRDRRLIGEVLAAYGRASGALEKPGFGPLRAVPYVRRGLPLHLPAQAGRTELKPRRPPAGTSSHRNDTRQAGRPRHHRGRPACIRTPGWSRGVRLPPPSVAATAAVRSSTCTWEYRP